MEQIKRANKLFSNDCIFLRNSLSIPVVSQKRSLFNGLSLESPDGDSDAACQEADARYVVTQDIEGPSPPPSPPPRDSKAPQPQPDELSAKDFLHRLDLQIKQSKQAARRLKEEEVRWGGSEAAHVLQQTGSHALLEKLFLSFPFKSWSICMSPSRKLKYPEVVCRWESLCSKQWGMWGRLVVLIKQEHVLPTLQVGTEPAVSHVLRAPSDGCQVFTHSLKKNRLNSNATEQLIQQCFCIKVSGDLVTAILNTMNSIISITWTFILLQAA